MDLSNINVGCRSTECKLLYEVEIVGICSQDGSLSRPRCGRLADTGQRFPRGAETIRSADGANSC